MAISEGSGKVLDENWQEIVPASFQVEFAILGEAIKQIQEFSSQIAELPGVESVTYTQEHLSFFANLLSIGNQAFFFIGIIVFIGSFLLMGHLCGQFVLEHKEKIEIMELVGANKWYIRRPFLLSSVLLGVLSGFCGLFFARLLTWKFSEILHQGFQEISLGPMHELTSFPWQFAIVATSGITCLLCAVFWLERVNTGGSMQPGQIHGN